jgi:hypothetical protein
MLPAVLEGPAGDVAYHVPHEDDLFKGLRELERSTGSFHCFRLSDRIYIWPKPGGAIPSAVDLSHAGTITASDIPSRALAHAVREAAADFMVGEPHNFERLRGRPVDPVRLFRRRRNLAAGAPKCYLFFAVRVIDERDLRRTQDLALTARVWFEGCGLYCYGKDTTGAAYEKKPVHPSIELDRVLAEVCTALRLLA